MKSLDLSLYVLLDLELLGIRPLEAVVEALISGGATTIQLRAPKGLLAQEFLAIGEMTKRAIRSRAGFIVNDRVDLSCALDADGVHLGQADLPIPIARKILGSEKLIGGSAQTIPQAIAAEAAGADYLGVGAIFSSLTKPDRMVVGPKRIREMKEAVKLPVVGIGGINARNVAQVIQAGADGAAVASALLKASDIQKATSELKLAIVRAREVGI
jgi:thiamine-phosphate pyrophosphorylase